MNTPGGNTMSAAEHTCAMIMALARHIPQGDGSMRDGRWDRKKYMGSEVMGKTLAIIGLGRIGKEVATRMQAFGMTTIGHDPILPADKAAEFGVEWLPLEEVWKRADYVTVHTPLIPATRNLIGKEVFAKCKRGLKVVNVARGGIVEEDAIVDAINAGQCGGVALDVFEEEPTPKLDLVRHPLVISTPHLGASTHEAQARVAEDIALQFVDTMNGKSLFGALNAQALSNALSPETKPWITLGKSLGSLATLMVPKLDKDTKVKITTHGEGMKKAVSYMSSAVLAGVLRYAKNGILNLINAPVFAKEMGIQVSTSYEEQVSNGQPRYASVSIQHGSGATYTIWGYVAGNVAYLYAINGAIFPTGTTLGGHMLIYNAVANPQVMPAVAATLAGEGVFPTTYFVSNEHNGQMWSVMTLSEPAKKMDALQQHVSQMYQVSF